MPFFPSLCDSNNLKAFKYKLHSPWKLAVNSLVNQKQIPLKNQFKSILLTFEIGKPRHSAHC